MLEKELERKLVKRMEQAGCMALKFTSPGHAGVPDRLLLLPGGFVVFVELKREGAKPRPLQEFMLNKLKKMGFRCLVISTEAEIELIVRMAISLQGGAVDG